MQTSISLRHAADDMDACIAHIFHVPCSWPMLHCMAMHVTGEHQCLHCTCCSGLHTLHMHAHCICNADLRHMTLTQASLEWQGLGHTHPAFVPEVVAHVCYAALTLQGPAG